MLGFDGIDLPRFLVFLSNYPILMDCEFIRFTGAFPNGYLNWESIPWFIFLFFLIYLTPNSHSWMNYKNVFKNGIVSLELLRNTITVRKLFVGGIIFFIATKPLFEDGIFVF